MAQAGQDVTLFARGPHLRAMQERGLRVISAEGDFEVHPRVIGNLKEAGPMDVIVLGVKAHGLTQLAPLIQPLIGENTTVVSTQNGIPWWYFHSSAGEFTGLHLERVDPGGVIAKRSGACVAASSAYFAAEIAEPGVIRHYRRNNAFAQRAGRDTLSLCEGHLPGVDQSRIALPSYAEDPTEIWVKILGNVAFVNRRSHAIR
jgi:2-dehydropantoate 2-reductase